MIAFHVVIPARLGSTRLPRKILREIAGKPLLQHVWESVRDSGAQETVIAADAAAVVEVCRRFGADAVLTSEKHQSGSDRVNEVAQSRGWADDAVVVNVQGDEPLMPPALVQQAAQLLAQDREADLSTVCHAIDSREEWLNPNIVKVVMDARQRALYFSRAPIPWKRVGTNPESLLPKGLAFRHIGLYAWRVAALARFSQLPAEPLETCESLEQLRALAQGFRIKLGITDAAPPRGVDTEEDLLAVEKILTRK
ncbi:MAG: 3-deoxy-manno-octulosonate cytidylyltransferase [Pseudomonadota bacterium]